VIREIKKEVYGNPFWPEDKILMRNTFRWTLNGEVCRWCYDSYPMEEVLRIHELKLIEKIDENTAFVRGDIK
jgi:hypothetical protein